MRLLVVALPVLLAVPVVPAVAPLWTRWVGACREPAMAWPVGGPSQYTLRQDAYGGGAFGSRRSGGRTHNGIDLAAPLGTPVLAARSGLARVGRRHTGMGLYLELAHPDGSLTVYGHLGRRLVPDGQWVWRGQPIGTVGKTGNARARAIHPHLHFELRLHGVPVDPLEGYLAGTDPTA